MLYRLALAVATLCIACSIAGSPLQNPLRKVGTLEPYADASKMRGWRVKINSTYTHYAIFSEDDLEGRGTLQQKPLVIYIHGLAAQLDQLTWGVDGGFAKALVDSGHTLLSYDLHGHGYSDAPDTPLAWPEFVSQLEGLLSHLGVTEPFTLVGFSTGCFMANAFAARHPQQVKKLVLMSPFGGNLPFHSWPVVSGIAAVFVQALFEGNLCHMRTVYRILLNLDDTQLETFLKEIDVADIPVSIIAGEWDKDPAMQILQTAKRINATVSNSQLHVIPGGSHMSWATGDKAKQLHIRRIVLDFLQGVNRSPQ